MALLHRFTSEAGDDMLVFKDDRGWTLVVRETVKVGASVAVHNFSEISYNDDQIIEVAEKILELTREQG
jgi:hypothetical protein